MEYTLIEVDEPIQEGDILVFPPFGFGIATMYNGILCFVSTRTNGGGSLTAPLYLFPEIKKLKLKQ